MRIFIAAIIIACLLQTSFLPVNLCVILLICRSLVRPDRSNLYLACFSGILLGILSPINIGFYALTFLFLVQIVEVVQTSRISSNILTVLPFSFVLILALAVAEKLFLGQSLNFFIIIVESLLSLPIFIAVKFWEERFIVLPNIKLKL